MVKALPCHIPFPSHQTNFETCQKYLCEFANYSKPSQLLFKCNDLSFYGDQEIVFGSMLFLDGIKNNCNFDEPMILSVKMPEYIINIYIHASYTRIFDINCIKPEDIVKFLKFIDQYPTTILGINKLEHQIIKYFEINKINYNEEYELKEIIKKYKLKYLYLHMHLAKFNI